MKKYIVKFTITNRIRKLSYTGEIHSDDVFAAATACACIGDAGVDAKLFDAKTGNELNPHDYFYISGTKVSSGLPFGGIVYSKEEV